MAKKTEEGEGAVTVMPEPRPFFCCGDDKGDYNGGDDRLQGAGEERGREDGGREQPVLLLRLPQDWMSHRRCCRCIHHQRWRSCSLCFRGSLSFDHFYLLLFMQFIDVFVHVFTIYLRLFIYQATRLRDALSTAEVETWASRCFPADDYVEKVHLSFREMNVLIYLSSPQRYQPFPSRLSTYLHFVLLNLSMTSLPFLACLSDSITPEELLDARIDFINMLITAVLSRTL